jgi:hypothetical protein
MYVRDVQPFHLTILVELRNLEALTCNHVTHRSVVASCIVDLTVRLAFELFSDLGFRIADHSHHHFIFSASIFADSNLWLAAPEECC